MATKKKSKTKITKSPKKAFAKKAAPKKVAAKKAAPKKAAAPKKPHIRNPIVHWEIQSQNPALLHEFYSNALGWLVDANNAMNYGMVTSGGARGIGGGIGGSQEPGSRVLVYAEVESIPEVLEQIEAHGGKVLMPRTDLGPIVMALYSDPEGNTMGLIEPPEGP